MKKFNFPGDKSVALLLDPDKVTDDGLRDIIAIAAENGTDYIMAGGSITFNSTDSLIEKVKSLCRIPVVLFPGNLLQLSRKADAILLLSLILGLPWKILLLQGLLIAVGAAFVLTRPDGPLT
mgnify:CR=1 FL=1